MMYFIFYAFGAASAIAGMHFLKGLRREYRENLKAAESRGYNKGMSDGLNHRRDLSRVNLIPANAFDANGVLIKSGKTYTKNNGRPA